MTTRKDIYHRIEWIDQCKAYAIFAMVFAHCGGRMVNADAQTDHWIHLWHMPLFFIVSGMVLNEKKWMGWSNYGRFVKSRLKTLILPFLFWGTVCNVWIYLILNYLHMGGGKSADLGLMLEKYYNFHVTTISATGWFLPAIFLTELLFVAMANVIGAGKRTTIFYLALVAAGLFFLDFDRTPLLFSLDVVPFTIAFFAFGFLFKQQLTANKRLSPITVIALAAAVAACYWLPVEANIRVCHYSPRYIAWLVCQLVSFALIYIIKNSEALIKHFPGYKWIGETGKNTLVIYLLHGEILRVLPFGSIAINSPLATTACQLMVTAGVVALCLLAAHFINRFLPWSLGKF